MTVLLYVHASYNYRNKCSIRALRTVKVNYSQLVAVQLSLGSPTNQPTYLTYDFK